MQEYETIKQAILDACPNAHIRGFRLQKFPIEIKIFHSDEMIYTTPQQRLFTKYKIHRDMVIEEIKQSIDILDLEGCKKFNNIIIKESK